MQSRLFFGRQIHRPNAFDRDLTALALDVLEADDAGVEIEAAALMRVLERDQELMATCFGISPLSG